MSKLGVGVGEDFPVDDENGNGNGAGGQQGPRSEADDRAEYEDWKRRRDAWRSEREARRAQHDEWRARKRAFKHKMRAAFHDSFGDSRNWHESQSRRGGDGAPYYYWRPRFWPIGAFGMGLGVLALAVPILLLVLFFSLISAAFKAPFIILGVIALAWLILGTRHHHDHGRDRGRRYYYDSDIETPSGPRGPQPPPPPPSPTIITPPAAGK